MQILLPSPSFCPCGVVQPTCLPLMQEITGAKPVRDAIFIGAWLTGNSRPTWLRTRQPWTCKSSRADHFSDAPKALSAMHLLGKQASLVQFRVGAPFSEFKRSRASAQAGFISPLCPGQHRRLRPFSLHAAACGFLFVKRSLPEHHPVGVLQFLCSRSPMQRHDVENVASAGANPAASTSLGLQALK